MLSETVGWAKNTLRQFVLSGFKLLGNAKALNLFGDLWADHMSAQQLAGIFVEDGLNQPFGFIDGQGFAVGIQVKAPDTNCCVRRLWPEPR